jgi:hypothetical protein
MEQKTLDKDEISLINMFRIITSFSSILTCLIATFLYIKMNLKKKNYNKKITRTTINDAYDNESLNILGSMKDDTDNLIKDDIKSVVKYKLTNHIAFLLIISNLGYNLSTLISLIIDINQSYHFCTLQALLINIFDMSSVAWTSVVTLAIIKGKDYKSINDIKGMIICYSLYCFIIPIIISLG